MIMQMDRVETEQRLVPEFINGAVTKLRPVLESDLPRVAQIMAQAPLGFGDWEFKPASLQALKKKFEDEKEPGLWGKLRRFFVITDLEGTVAGLLQEDFDRSGRVQIHFQLDELRADRGESGPDMLQAYKAYRRDFQNTPRIETMVVAEQYEQIQWLLASGFEHEITAPQCMLHRGQITDLALYAWVDDWVLARRAPHGGAER